jgi:uncharacterized protein DUF2630
MTSDADVLAQIKALVEEEHGLTDTGSSEESQRRRRQLEEQLDQCWDLLRQRQARRDAGQNPDDSHARPTTQVEGYLQ